MLYYPQPMQGGAFNNAPSYPYAQQQQLGYGGYNGGYFSGGYNTYNPYEIQRQQQLQQQAYMAEVNNQRQQMSRLYKSSCSTMGIQPEQMILDGINGVQSNKPRRIEGLTPLQQNEYDSLYKAEMEALQANAAIESKQYAPRIDYRYNLYANNANRLATERKKETPDDMSLADYLNSGQASEDLYNANQNIWKQEQSNLGQLYNNTGYNRFLNQFKQSGPFAALNPNATIDDLTITLPSLVSEKERAERRKAFLAQIGIGG